MTSFIRMFSFAEGDRDDEDVDREPPTLPPWFGPPEDELGAVVLWVSSLAARRPASLRCPTPRSTRQALRWMYSAARGLSNSQSNRLFHEQHLFEEGEEPPSGFLRIGLELPDGERVSNLGGRMSRRHFTKPDEEPQGPVFTGHGGGGGSGGQGRVRMSPAFWLWPRPESGALRVFCEWPIVEISLSTADIDAGELAAAADRVVPLWPEPLA